MAYNNDDVREKCLRYFNGDELATSVIMNKYLLKSKEGEFLESDPDEMLDRVATEFARIESDKKNPLSKEQILEAFGRFKKIIPQGSPLFGIGNNEQLTSIANCFAVASPDDCYSSILKRDEELAQIMKRRGGVGIDLSTLRPSGTVVNNAAKSSDGVTCFMERYSNTTKEVAQNGRRGALMEALDCRHPDLEDFIMIKRNLNKVTGANISIKWHDDFLKAVERDEEYTLRFPVDAPVEQATFTKVVKAKDIWNKFVESNWMSAEPGCYFWDRIVSQSLSDCYPYFPTVVTNPCGELPLSPYGSCILMLMNMTGFITNPYTEDAKFDKEDFEKYVRMAMRLIDDMIDLEIEKINKILAKIENDPESDDIKRGEKELWEKVRENYERGRRVGLGVTGLGDMLAMLGIKYASDEALGFIEDVFCMFHTYLMDENAVLAEERGAFPEFDWNLEKDCTYNTILPTEVQERIKKHGRRNISITTIAPAGSISILTQTSSGVEPVFKRSYDRRRKMTKEEIDSGMKPESIDNDGIKWTAYEVHHHGFKKWQELNPNVPTEESPYWESEAGELDWRYRVKLQGMINKYITHSISSTVNLAKDITREEVSELYLQAWKDECKGITIYRDGCRQGVLFDKKGDEEEITMTSAPKRPKILECDIHYSHIDGNEWIFFVGLMKNRPYDIFGGKRSNVEISKKYKKGWIVKNGKVNGIRTYDLYLGSLDDSNGQIIIRDIAHEFSPDTGYSTRMHSAMLRHGMPIKFVCEQLHKIDPDASMFSFEKSVARVLKKYIRDGEEASESCSECGNEMVYAGGCPTCMSCGYTKCS